MQILKALSNLFPFLMSVSLGLPFLLKKLWGRGWSVVIEVTKVCIIYASFAVRQDSLLCVFSSPQEIHFSLLSECVFPSLA